MGYTLLDMFPDRLALLLEFCIIRRSDNIAQRPARAQLGLPRTASGDPTKGPPGWYLAGPFLLSSGIRPCEAEAARRLSACRERPCLAGRKLISTS